MKKNYKDNRIKVKHIISLIIMFTITSSIFFILGWFSGTSFVIPENITINSEDLQLSAEEFSKYAEVISEAYKNQSCNINITGGEEFYVYAINSYKQVLEKEKQNVQVVERWCKTKNRVNTLFLNESYGTYLLELNEPKKNYELYCRNYWW